MATDLLYYGGAIPGQHLATWYGDINVWMDDNLDNQVARKVTYLNSQLDPETEDYELSKIDYKSAIVKPQAKKTPGVEVSIGGSGERAKIRRWPAFFVFNESDINKSPTLYSHYVSACMTAIMRGEDYVWYNGDTRYGITGMKTTAEANSNGKVAASGGTYNNNGAWLTDDSGDRDIHADLLMGRGLLDSRFRANLKNLFLVGNASSLDALDQKDPYSDNSTTIAASVCSLFGRTPADPVDSWAIKNDQIDDGYVFICCKNQEAGEILQARTITIDDNYPRRPIGNLEVHLYQDVGIAFHNPNAYVEIAIT